MLGSFGGSFGGSGVKKYATTADLPLTGVKPGTLAHVEENLQGDSALYLWSGTQLSGGWYKVATVNLAPSILQGPEAAYALPTDGSPITISLVAEDPEGLPITWSYQLSDGSLEGVAEVVQDGGNFMIAADPAAVAGKTPGAFSLTFVASDGVSLSAATSAFTLSFGVGPGDPSNLTLESTFVAVSALGVELQYLVPGEEGVLFGINVTDATLGGVYALDISDPENVSLISFYQPPGLETGSGRVTACYGFGKLAFTTSVNTQDGVVVDVSDAANMLEISRIPGLMMEGVVAFANNGNHLIGCSLNGGIRSATMGGLNINVVSDLNPYGLNNAAFRHPPNYDGSVFAWNTYDSTPGKRALLAQCAPDGTLTLLSENFPFESATLREHWGEFDGTILLYPVQTNGEPVRLFDCSDPTTPVAHSLPEIAGDITPADGIVNGRYQSSCQLDGYAYMQVARAEEQVRVFNISDLSSPVHLGLLPAADVPGSTFISEPAPVFSGGRMFVIASADKSLRVLK